MRKVWIVAQREYRAIVGTKAFLIALTMMPVLMFGGIFVQRMLGGYRGSSERKVVVVDGTGTLFDALAKAAEAQGQTEVSDPATGAQVRPGYILERGPQGPLDDQTRFELSERVRRREIAGFVEIPADVLTAAGGPSRVSFYAENAAVADERQWLQQVLNECVRTHRLRQAGIDPEVVARASAPVVVEPLGLVEQTPTGEFTEPQEVSLYQAIFIPFGIMMLMWVVIFLAAQPMMESVLEEKSQRIAEVLLGSVNTFQLMLGKLLGGVGGSLTVVALYGLGAVGLAWHYDCLHLVPLRVVPWFIIYQVLAVMFFGSVFMAVGSAVNQLKEAQSMLLPVWLVMMFPLFIWLQAVREPMGGLATAMSFFPPATPLMMVLRIGASAAVPWWQAALGIVVLLAATMLCVLAAARVFRIGFLSQGKTPRLSEVLRWAIRG